MNRKAFTLIELLVVIAIIAILAAILFPVFAQAKMAAKKTQDLSNVKQHATALLIYAGDADDALMAQPWGNAGMLGANPKRLFWSDLVMPYVKSRDMFSATANTSPVYNVPGAYRFPGARTDAETPTTPGHTIYRVTYALNHMVGRGDVNFANPGSTVLTAVDVPAEIVMVGPSQYGWTWSSCQVDAPGSQNMSYFWNVSANPGPSGWSWGYEIFGVRGSNITAAGFNQGANFSFTDGHAGYSKLVPGGDAKDGVAANGLYTGYFPRAKTRNLVSSAGPASCPGDRGAMTY